jgi:hypothetical protein
MVLVLIFAKGLEIYGYILFATASIFVDLFLYRLIVESIMNTNNIWMSR